MRATWYLTDKTGIGKRVDKDEPVATGLQYGAGTSG